MLKLDEKRCNFGRNQRINNYRTYYDVYYSNSMDYVDVLTDGHAACYSGFWNKFSGKTTPKGRKPNKISTALRLEPTSVTLTLEEGRRWVELAVKYGFLPDYVKPEETVVEEVHGNGTLVAKLVLNLTKEFQSKLYMRLDTLRHLRENPGFVKAVVYLHDELNINFYAAFVMASYWNVHNSGHHILTISRNTMYDKTNEPKPGDKLNLKLVRSLYKFTNCKSIPGFKFGQRIGEKNIRWCCSGKINELNAYDMVVPIERLDAPEIETIIKTVNNKKAKALYDAFMKKLKK